LLQLLLLLPWRAVLFGSNFFKNIVFSDVFYICSPIRAPRQLTIETTIVCRKLISLRRRSCRIVVCIFESEESTLVMAMA
jgi:hypothetical protein